MRMRPQKAVYEPETGEYYVSGVGYMESDEFEKWAEDQQNKYDEWCDFQHDLKKEGY